MEEKCFQETQKVVKLSKSTLAQCIKGGRSIRQAHEESKWLLKGETDAVIKYAIECADHNFPLNHRWVKEHVNEIAHARWGDVFPKTEVGKQLLG
jgi:hypothetical protein